MGTDGWGFPGRGAALQRRGRSGRLSMASAERILGTHRETSLFGLGQIPVPVLVNEPCLGLLLLRGM